MTTVSIFILFVVAMFILAVINLFLWLLEAIAATIRWLLSYFLSRPHNWEKSYMDIRIFFTEILLKISFAMLSPKTMMRHQRYIRSKNWQIHHKISHNHKRSHK